MSQPSLDTSAFAEVGIERYLRWPMDSLGVEISVSTIEKKSVLEGDHFSLHFARSQHNQLALWPIVQHWYLNKRLVTSKPDATAPFELMITKAQDAISQLPWFGSGLIRFDGAGDIYDLHRGVHRESMWTLDFSLTSQCENEVRAVMDLPLGDIKVDDQPWMTVEFSAPAHLDMVRPYLHLSARNPRLKFHHYGTHDGVMSLAAEHELQEELEHALHYIEGIIEE